MFNLTEADMVGTTNKLLYNILMELQRMNTPVCSTREGIEVDKPKLPVITCKRCGAKIQGHGEFLRHAKACKKEGK